MRRVLGFWTWTSSGGVSLTDYFNITKDMNTSILKYLNFYYSTSYQDIQQPLARYLREGSAQDLQNQWLKLYRRVRGIST